MTDKKKPKHQKYIEYIIYVLIALFAIFAGIDGLSSAIDFVTLKMALWGTIIAFSVAVILYSGILTPFKWKNTEGTLLTYKHFRILPYLLVLAFITALWSAWLLKQTYSKPKETYDEVVITSPYNWTHERQNIQNTGKTLESFNFPLKKTWSPFSIISAANIQPITDNQKVIVSTFHGQRIYILDVRNGKLIRQIESTRVGQDRPIATFPTSGNLAIQDGILFVNEVYYGRPSHLRAFDIDNGNRLVWEFKSQVLSNDYPLVRHPDTAPLIFDDHLFVANDFFIYKINKRTGALVDSVKQNGEIISTPSIDPRTRQLFVLKQFWNDTFEIDTASAKDYSYSTHIYMNALIIMRKNDVIPRFSKLINGKMELSAVSTVDLKERWRLRIDKGWTFFSSPVVYRRDVFLGTDSKLYCINKLNGKIKWEKEFEGGISTPAIDSELFFIHKRSSELISLSTDDGGIIWRKKIPEIAGDYSPTIAQNAIFVITQNQVLALNRDDGQTIWRSKETTKISSSISVGYHQLFFSAFDKSGNGPFLYSFTSK